jgi:hypothetical protein
MAKQTLRIVSLNPVNIGNYVGTFYAILGVAVGLIVAFGSAFSVWLGEEGLNLFEGLGFGLTVGILSIVVFPFIYFVIGWIQGAVFGLLFNVVTHYMGGIEIETK